MESARADAARYEGNIAQDIDALQLLVGAPLDPTLLPEAFDANTMGLAALPAEPAIGRCCCGGPTCSRPSILLRVANGNIGAARAAFFPTISLTAAIGSASTGICRACSSPAPAPGAFSPR